MKKILLSISLIGVFIVYVFLERSGRGSGSSVAVAPTPAVPSASSAPPAPMRSSSSGAGSGAGRSGSMGMGSGGTMFSGYRNGTYTGSVENVFFGNVQVQISVRGGKVADVMFLQYPNDRSYSQYVSSIAIPALTQEAIRAQNSQVDIVSGATQTSLGFQQSLASALAKAS